MAGNICIHLTIVAEIPFRKKAYEETIGIVIFRKNIRSPPKKAHKKSSRTKTAAASTCGDSRSRTDDPLLAKQML